MTMPKMVMEQSKHRIDGEQRRGDAVWGDVTTPGLLGPHAAPP